MFLSLKKNDIEWHTTFKLPKNFHCHCYISNSNLTLICFTKTLKCFILHTLCLYLIFQSLFYVLKYICIKFLPQYLKTYLIYLCKWRINVCYLSSCQLWFSLQLHLILYPTIHIVCQENNNEYICTNSFFLQFSVFFVFHSNYFYVSKY